VVAVDETTATTPSRVAEAASKSRVDKVCGLHLEHTLSRANDYYTQSERIGCGVIDGMLTSGQQLRRKTWPGGAGRGHTRMAVGGPLVHTGAHHSPRGPTPTTLLDETAKQYWVSGRKPRTTAVRASPTSPTAISPRSKRSTPSVGTVRGSKRVQRQGGGEGKSTQTSTTAAFNTDKLRGNQRKGVVSVGCNTVSCSSAVQKRGWWRTLGGLADVVVQQRLRAVGHDVPSQHRVGRAASPRPAIRRAGKKGGV
jgi:hypothetical protein